jgi:hypothetical protein
MLRCKIITILIKKMLSKAAFPKETNNQNIFKNTHNPAHILKTRTEFQDGG